MTVISAMQQPRRRSTTGSTGSRATALLGATALLVGLVAATSTAVVAPAAAAALTHLKLDFRSGVEAQQVVANPAWTPTSPPAVPKEITVPLHKGDPLPTGLTYQFLIQREVTGVPNDSSYNCLPPGKASGSHDADYPNNCQWPGTRTSNTGDPIIASGTQDDINQAPDALGDPLPGIDLQTLRDTCDAAANDANAPRTAESPEQPCRFLVSIKADGYEIGGAHFSLGADATLTAPPVVSLLKYPLPLANIRIRVFQDTVPVDGVYEIDAEQGLGNFRAYLNDLLGDVSTDYYGNPICTKYETTGGPDGPVVFNLDGPVIASDNIGQCLSNSDGDILIPNMAPGRYGIVIRQPSDKKSWLQTTTLEGAQDHDWWVMAGDTGYGTETTAGGELVPEVQFGFVPPEPNVGRTWLRYDTGTNQDVFRTRATGAVARAVGPYRLSGAVHEGCTYIASVGGAYVPNSVPGANGAKDCGPIAKPLIAISGLDVGDQVVWAGAGNADGTYSIPGLASGSYMVTVWDAPINHILETFNVTIAGANVDAGTTYLGGWFTHITGSVFIDTNGNGRRDAGEQGVQRSTLAFRERDNTPMDQFTNAIDTDVNGEYDIQQAYPLSRFMILEHANPRYKPTGITVQACNEKKPTTYLGSAVDIAVLPVIGLCGRVDWAVEPYASGETGGIVGTITYGTTRNELDPADAATESWQPGISGIKVHLFAVARGTDGKPIVNADGSIKRGKELAETYTSETFDKPTGCVARDNNGAILTGEKVLADPAKNTQCVEAPMAGWFAKPSEPDNGATAQTVNGNYGFGTSKLNLYAPGDPRNPAPNHDLPLYDPLTPTYPEQVLKADDYLVSVEIPNDAFGKPMYKITREEDVNIFGGDEMLPQGNFPATSEGSGPGGTPTPGDGGSEGLGVIATCAGPWHEVDVTNPDFIAGGGSPYQGDPHRNLCTDKLINVVDATQQVTNFEMFTDVPLASHFWGLILNDLGVSSDPTKIQYGEVEGLPNAPTGIYDWAGNLVDTAIADPNGFYEAIEPSTVRINNPSPSGVSPGMYKFVGNDPGTRGHLNPTYDSRYRTIATNFQAWPGLWTVTDTAPTLTAAQTFNGQMTAVKCLVSDKEPQIFAVDNPVFTGAGTLTISGRDFGTQGPGSAVLLGAPGATGATADPNAGTPMTVTAWTDTSITVAVPDDSAAFPAGPRQLLVRADHVDTAGVHHVKPTTTGITIHVLGSGYNPAVFLVGHGVAASANGQVYETNPSAPGATVHTLQEALDATASTAYRGANPLVVVYPQAPVDPGNPSGTVNDTTIPNPTGAYFENIVIHSGARLQGIGTGGFRADGSYVFGSVLDGSTFQEGQPNGTAWLNLVGGLNYVNDTDSGAAAFVVPDSATVTVLTPTAANDSTTGYAKPAGIDGLTITGGIQSTTPTNVNVLTGGTTTPYGGTGAVVTQGGGIYVHGGTDGLVVSNNRIDGNSGSYAGAIRVGTPYANGNIGVTNGGANDPQTVDSPTYLLRNSGLVVAHNSITNNGGANLGGGVGLFSGTSSYRVAYNDVCGNFSAEYGGGISHYGFSPGSRIDHNRVWFNESYDEGGGILVAGEVPPTPDDVTGGSGAVTIDDNKIDQNLSNDDGGGIRLLNAGVRRIAVENNEIVNNVSAHEGGGIALNDAANVVIDNNTIARNVTTATAVTSDGTAAPTGIATGATSSQLRALIAHTPGLPGSAEFSDPVTYNNILWDNRAGTFDGLIISGIDDASPNVWDIGSLDQVGTITVGSSVVTPSGLNQLTEAATQPNTDLDPKLVNPFTLSVHADARRSFVVFRQTVISDMTVSPWNTGDYSIGAGSSAEDFGTTAPAPASDITGFARQGTADAGAYELFTTPHVVPGTPTGVILAPDVSQIRVSWTAPAVAGNPAVSGYTARAWSAASGGSFLGSCSTATTTCVIGGLTNGTQHFVDVVAINAVGTSPATSPRVTATPDAQPPVVTSVTPTSGALNVTFTAPLSQVAPVSYTARAWSAPTGGTTPVRTCTRTSPGTCQITGLTNGTHYFVDVTANYSGAVTATSAPRIDAVPQVQKPEKPTIVKVAGVSGVNTALDVTFTPGATGGAPATYVATAYTTETGSVTAGVSCSPTGGASTSLADRTCRITGLTPLTTYWVSVVAHNVIGDSVPSDRVARAPAGTPGVPTSVSFSASPIAGRLDVTWVNPAATGGVPLLSSTATVYATSFLGTSRVTECVVTVPDPTACTFTGLPRLGGLVRYYVRVAATNTSLITGPQSAVVPGVVVNAAPGAVAALASPTGATTLLGFTSRVASAPTAKWTVRVYASAASTRVLASCRTTTKAGTCSVGKLVRGRVYYLTVVKTAAPWPVIKAAHRVKVRVR